MRWRDFFGNRTLVEQLIAYGLLGMTLGIMVAVVWPSLNNTGYLSAWDAGGHLLKAHYFAHHLLPGGHLTGWFPLWHGGFDLFQFYPPLLYYLLGPLTLALPAELSLRLMTAALWLGLVPVTYYFLRSFNLDRLVAGLGTTFLLGLNASFGIGLGALYGVGLLPNGLGFILAIWTLGRLKRDLSRPDRRPYQFLLTGLLVGLLILAHTFSAYWWVLASLVLLATETIGGRRTVMASGSVLKRYGCIVLIAALVSAYWWLPLLANLGQMGETGAIQQSPRTEIAAGLLLAKDSGGLVISLLALGGFAYLAAIRRWRTFGFFAALTVLSLLLSLNLINDILPFRRIVASSQFIRFHAFFAWLLTIMAVFGLAGVWQLLRLARIRYLPYAATGALAVLLFVTVTLPTLDAKRGFVHVSDTAATRELPAAADFLEGNVRPGEFILSEFNWDARFYYGSPHFVNHRLPLLAAGAPVWDLDGNFPEGADGAARPVLIASVMGQTDYLRTQQLYLQTRGIRYLVSDNLETRAALEREPWLIKAWQGRFLAVFELRDYQQRFGLPAAAAAQLAEATYQDPGTYRLRFARPTAIPPSATTALSYHPWLRVTGDDRPVAAIADEQSRLSLPEGTAPVSELTISYQPGNAAAIGNGLSLLTLLAIVGLLLRPRWLARTLEIARRNGRRRPATVRGRRRRSGGRGR